MKALKCIYVVTLLIAAAPATRPQSEQQTPPNRTNYTNFEVGIKINGSYGTNGSFIESTGIGSAFGSPAGGAGIPGLTSDGLSGISVAGASTSQKVNGVFNEVLFAGANLSARVAAACASVASPVTITIIQIPPYETDATAAIPAKGLGEWCKVYDQRGLAYIYARAGNTSICTGGTALCPSGELLWGEWSLAGANSTNKLVKEFYGEAVAGGVNANGNKTNYVGVQVGLRGRTPGQHINLGLLNSSWSNGDVLGLSEVQDCGGKPSAAGDQQCTSIGLTVNSGWGPSAGYVVVKGDSSCQSGSSSCLTLCGTNSASTGQCAAAMTGGGELGEQNYLVNTSRNVYNTGTVSGIAGTPPTVTGVGTAWMTNLCGGSPCSPTNLYFEMTGEATGLSLTGGSSFSVAGATVTGPGTVFLSSFTDSCSGASGYIVLNGSNVVTSFVVLLGGTQCVSSGSISSTCTTGTISCSGTVTFTPSFGAASGVHLIIPITSIASDTSLALNLTSEGVNQPYTGAYTSGGSYNIYQGSAITGVPDISGELGNTNTNPFTTVQASVADPTQFTAGDTFWDGHGEIEGAQLFNGVVNQNNMWPSNPSASIIGVNQNGRYPVPTGLSVTGGFARYPLILDWHANSAGITPFAGIELQGPPPLDGFINMSDFSNASLLNMLCAPNSGGGNRCLSFDRTLATNYFAFNQSSGSAQAEYLTTDGRIGVGMAPVTSVAGAFNGTIQATGATLSGLNVAGVVTNTSGGLLGTTPKAGSGAGFTTGPTTSINNDVVIYTGTAGQTADSTKALAGSGAAIPTGPASGVTSGDAVCYTGTAGQQQDCGTPAGGKIGGGFCSGVATSSTTLEPFGLGSTTTTCTSGALGSANPVAFGPMAAGGTISKLGMICGTTGVNASSGVATLYYLRSGVQNASTLTVTYGTTAADTLVQDSTHTLAYQAGDIIKVAFTTQLAETLANCAFSFQY